jgi:hypothetical protein
VSYIQSLLPLARQALSQPRESAATLLSMGVPREALWPSFFLLVVLSILMVSLGTSADTVGNEGLLVASPIVMALITAVVSVVSVVAVWKVGQTLGGRGTFEETLLLTVFLQAILFAGQLIELFLALTVPPVAAMFNLAIIVLAVWLNVNFIATLHGFASIWKSFGVLILASIGVALVLVFMMTLAGIGVSNV